jgi:acid phosphatase
MRSPSTSVALVEPLESRTLFAGTAPPHFDHVVIVVEENHSYDDVLGSGNIIIGGMIFPQPPAHDPFIRQLAKRGASFTNFRAETHPSQGNYLAMFSGSTQGVDNDKVPEKLITAPSLGGRLRAAGVTFTGYSEGLPRVGYAGPDIGKWVRHHVPWSEFADVPKSKNRPFTDFPADFAKLPQVAFVVPNNVHNMHSGSIAAADDWLKSNLGDYAAWAPKHNSLLIVTWDEGHGSRNQIATIFYGAHVKAGKFSESATHYNLLRAIEDMEGVSPLGASAGKNVSNLRDAFA